MNYDDKPQNNLDLMLRKYIAVWLWSILFGGTTGLTYTLISFSTGERWGQLSYVLGVMTVLGIYMLSIAWFYLYIYLRQFLIPIVLLGEEIDDPNFHKRGGNILSRAYLLMIVAGVLGLSTRAVQYLLQAVAGH